jgi:hypothetical protein
MSDAAKNQTLSSQMGIAYILSEIWLLINLKPDISFYIDSHFIIVMLIPLVVLQVVTLSVTGVESAV